MSRRNDIKDVSFINYFSSCFLWTAHYLCLIHRQVLLKEGKSNRPSDRWDSDQQNSKLDFRSRSWPSFIFLYEDTERQTQSQGGMEKKQKDMTNLV